MSKLILLDTGVLGYIVHGNKRVSGPAVSWMQAHLDSSNQFRVPEIADYELRRSLIRLNSVQSIDNLNNLKLALGYLALDTEIILEAASMWAHARLKGFATASDKALDADVILAAQAKMAAKDHSAFDVIIATTNVVHLGKFVFAQDWRQMTV